MLELSGNLVPNVDECCNVFVKAAVIKGDSTTKYGRLQETRARVPYNVLIREQNNNL